MMNRINFTRILLACLMAGCRSADSASTSGVDSPETCVENGCVYVPSNTPSNQFNGTHPGECVCGSTGSSSGEGSGGSTGVSASGGGSSVTFTSTAADSSDGSMTTMSSADSSDGSMTTMSSADSSGGITMSGSASATAGDSSGDGSTGDPPPPCELRQYTCHMKQLHVYTTASTGIGGIRTINPQAGNYGEGQTYACVDVDIVFPEADLDDAMLAAACSEACYLEDLGLLQQDPDLPITFYSATPGLSAQVPPLPNPVCVPATTDNLSGAAYAGYAAGSGSATCAGQSGVAITDHGPATEEQCMVAIESCDDWDPQAYVMHSSRNGIEHTIRFDSDFRDQLYWGGGWGYLYACDAARYQQILSGGVESWQVVESTVGTLIYTMGLRNGDKDFTIAHSTTATQYALNSFAAISAAAEQMAGDSQLTLRWKRQNTAGAWVTHTAQLYFD